MDDIPLDANDLYALVRSVAKNGDFFMAAAELASASHILNSSQTVCLYEHIRDSSDRLEMEWRDEFIAAFSGVESLLPESLW
ncbi:hypothetical protein [Pseudomonas sediminis]|uniref:Uncharacterized protein n=1 Tax=Pseudomonas sediminis TaxID=1691904 RepID=A0ABX6SG96_9PSED|nr:hypothetical protein [Pseudomonas sediminis]QNH00127.1 hypothetical protein HNQ25_17760 [Pseudomonas sediminis]